MSGFNVLLRMFHSNIVARSGFDNEIQSTLNLIGTDQNFFYGGGGLFHPYLLINNLFSAETKFPTVSKILPPILNISPNGQKVNPCVYGGMDGEKLQQTGLFFCLLYFSTFSTFLHYSPLTDRVRVFQSVQSH